ncbi:MAG: hypothetical protein HQL86_04925 [Magnetococcales bacterium]|nr:hypothetical protein [Magnetococcales bacterium]
MTPEQHEQLIDHLFKRINLRGEGLGQVSVEGEGPSASRGRGGKRTMEHVDPFSVDQTVTPESTPEG